MAASRTARRSLRDLLRMRKFINAIKNVPHPEEPAQPASRRTRGGAATFLSRWLILAMVLGLAACTVPDREDYASLVAAQAASVSAAPQLAEDKMVMADGTALPLRVWLPKGEVKAVVLAVHGFNDYSNAFEGPARALAAYGIATYAYDQRGFGAAPLHGRWPGRWQLADDLATASRLVRARHPGNKLYLMGESMGAAVAIVAMTGETGTPRPTADGLILAAPAVWGWQTMGVLERGALAIGMRLMPGMTVSGRGIIKITPSDNNEMLRGLSRDPLVIKSTRIDSIYGLVDLMDAAFASAERLDMPLLYLYGQRDEIVPKKPTELMIEHLPPESRGIRRVAWYANGYHMLMRDLDSAVVMGDIASWIAERRAPLPSGADLYADAVLGLGAVAQAAGQGPGDKPFAKTAADALGSPARGERSSAAPGHP
jgi:acylglycerol lipase